MANLRDQRGLRDACIIGAGAAGLSAAMLLGRCRRDVVVFDSAQPRNSVSRGLHGFLTRDGIAPWELREIGRAQLAAYPSIALRELTVTAAMRRADGFELRTSDGAVTRCRLLLLATGRVDELPDRPGFRSLYGRGVYHCPLCDGWEHRDQPLVAYGCGEDVFHLARELFTWTVDVTICSDGSCGLNRAQHDRLTSNAVKLIETPIAELRARPDGLLAAIRFVDGTEVRCDALFFTTSCPQKSALPASLGCTFDAAGSVKCDQHAATNVPGLFVAGNVRGGLHLAITAAAEGAEAAVAMNDALVDLDLA